MCNKKGLLLVYEKSRGPQSTWDSWVKAVKLHFHFAWSTQVKLSNLRPTLPPRDKRILSDMHRPFYTDTCKEWVCAVWGCSRGGPEQKTTHISVICDINLVLSMVNTPQLFCTYVLCYLKYIVLL